jgi:alkanesulfonate monooxygenase SsuD/methylene tetrahydromethanopterin reductase-like flavin-dependent oxidoreductase (luciferase family)
MVEQMLETPTDGSERVGLALRDPMPWRKLVEIVETGERTGYEAVFVPEIAGREAFATLAGLAARTSTLHLGTGVVTIATRSLSATAMGAATVHELSGGRMILGLGTGPAGPGALGRLRGFVYVLRRALGGETVELSDGGHFRLTLEVASEPVPIWIAALGPEAMRMAGEVADGVLLNWCPPERVAFARQRIREGAERAGRDPAAVTVAVYVRACVGQELESSITALRAAAGQYASYRTYRRQFEAVGLGEEAAAAAAAFGAGRPEEVPEALVRRVCLLGEPKEAALRLDAYRDAGADLQVVYPVPTRDLHSSILGTVFALAPHPAVEA